MKEIKEITVKELAEFIKDKNSPLLLDVRNQNERDFANIGGLFIPLPEIEERFSEIPRDKELVVYCHHGVRSLYACQFLLENGFSQVTNLSGGIDAWSLQVDPNVPRY